MTVRELIQMLVLNCNLDDRVDIETMNPIEGKDEEFCFRHHDPKRVIHFPDNEALIECHD